MKIFGKTQARQGNEYIIMVLTNRDCYSTTYDIIFTLLKVTWEFVGMDM